MKALSRPISSPSRTEKFPTPLMMRFLRGNVGSRSRGRSRSSPMFIVRNKKNAAAPLNEAQQEPSSPKVTCIGQVRARRSSSKTTAISSSSVFSASKSKRTVPSVTPKPKQSPYHSFCYCCCCCHGHHDSKRFHFSQRFTSKFLKPRSVCRPFRKWGSFFRFGYCKKVDTRDDSSRFQSVQSHRNQFGSISSGSELEDVERFARTSKIIQEPKELNVQSSTPPKNALLLTRCRSAPYRSSSLAVRFWGSPLGTSETEKLAKGHLEDSRGGGKERLISPSYGSQEGESSRSSHEESGELDDCGSGKPKEERNEDLRKIDCGPLHPLLLTRCKSEPAKTGERLIPDANFWRQRRSDTAESCLRLDDLIN